MGSRDQKAESSGGFFSAIRSWGSAVQKSVSGLLGYEGLEVINPEGGTEDAEAEAQRGRWRQEIGQGTYNNVYRARGLDNGKVVALKKVRLDNLEPESVRFMAREIHILCRLDHPNVVKLDGLVTSRMPCSLYLVLEYMEHDLPGLASFPGMKFSEPPGILERLRFFDL